MRAIVLAAGRGSRLLGWTDDRPKCLNRVGGRTILEHLRRALEAGGVEEVAFVTGYRAEMIVAEVALTLHNEAWRETNMVSSLLCASRLFDRSAVVSYADIVYGPGTVSRLIAAEGAIVVAYDRGWRALWERRFENPLEDAESFRVDESGRILEIGRRAASLEEIEGQYMGLLKIEPEGFAWIQDVLSARSDVPRLDMTALLSLLIERGREIRGIAVEEGWCEIDTPRDLELACRLAEEGRLVSPGGGGS